CAALGGMGIGCTNHGMIADYEKRILGLEEDLRKCNSQRMAMQEHYQRAQDRIEAGAGARQSPDKFFAPVDLVIDSLTGGTDFDNQPGDDGVSVYLRPVDRDGDALKVAGDVRIELLDLANSPGGRIVGRYEISAEELSGMWVGKLLTNQFIIKCKWQGAPPQHSELTVRVSFYDYLSRQVFSAQRTCHVDVPPR
ncbi:MAG: hypothetical protein AB7N71_07900, partial [Phycisphaerae bacterium]